MRKCKLLLSAVLAACAIAVYASFTSFSVISSSNTAYAPSMSKDARYVAYWVGDPTVTNTSSSIVLFDRQTGNSSTISGTLSAVTRPRVSFDGHWVAFWGRTSSDANFYPYVFEIATLPSTAPVKPIGLVSNLIDLKFTVPPPAVSSTVTNSRPYVVFPNPYNGVRSVGLSRQDLNHGHLMIWDYPADPNNGPSPCSMVTSTTAGTDVSLTTGCTEPVISGDGTTVAFTCDSSNLASGTGDAYKQIYKAVGTPGGPANWTVSLVSKSSGGTKGNDPSDQPTISEGGTKIAFASLATNLAGSPSSDNAPDLFLRNESTSTTTWVYNNGQALTLVPIPTWAYDRDLAPAISADGSAIAFHASDQSNPSGLTWGLNQYRAVFVQHAAGGSFELTSRASGTTTTVKNGHLPALNEDGTKVAFDSEDSGLCSGDTTPSHKVYFGQ